jgi:DNA-binding CsgD family transcriptional regulator
LHLLKHRARLGEHALLECGQDQFLIDGRPLRDCRSIDNELLSSLQSLGLGSLSQTALPGYQGGHLTVFLPDSSADGLGCGAKELPWLAGRVVGQLLALAQQECHIEEARHFTRRELEVVDYFLAGATTAETGAALGIGASSVRTHLDNIYAKIGAVNQRQAVARLVELGLLRRGNALWLGSESGMGRQGLAERKTSRSLAAGGERALRAAT